MYITKCVLGFWLSSKRTAMASAVTGNPRQTPYVLLERRSEAGTVDELT